jgi:dipeptidyl aminopeptidase/acylaminoacyl peptidase
MFRAAGGQEQQLTSPDLGTVWWPSIDPTGNKIAFTITGEKPGVYVVTTDPIKSVLTRQTTDAGDRAPTWFSATGIAFERRNQTGPTTTHRIDTETGDVADVTDPNIYMTSNPATGELLMLTQSKRDPFLWLDPITGKKRRAPRGGPSALSRAIVSPNGQWLVVQGGAANAVWRAKLPDDLELVHEETGGRNVGNVALDDQGRMIATPAEPKGELFVVKVRNGQL